MKLYGYVLTEEWLMDYAMKHQLGGPHHPNDAISKVLSVIKYTCGWAGKGICCQMGWESASVPGTRPCSWS